MYNKQGDKAYYHVHVFYSCGVNTLGDSDSCPCEVMRGLRVCLPKWCTIMRSPGYICVICCFTADSLSQDFEINEISRVKAISSVWNRFPGLIQIELKSFEFIWNQWNPYIDLLCRVGDCISLISNDFKSKWNHLKSMKSISRCFGIWNQWNHFRWQSMKSRLYRPIAKERRGVRGWNLGDI